MRRTLVGLTLLSCTALGGCVAALVGGAAAGGYYVGKDDRPASTIAEDAAVTAEVKSKLIVDGRVKAFAINVDTYRGEVTLHGTVHESAQAAAAVADARSARGVKAVHNQLQVK